MKQFKYLFIILSLFIIFSGIVIEPIEAQDTCYADFNLNGDEYPLSVADWVLLVRMMNGDTTYADNMYRMDLNADCVIDDGDIDALQCFFVYGIAPCFPVWPVPTCCDPLLIVGACCLSEDSCTMRSEENCAAIGGDYLGDGTSCLPDSPCTCCKGIRGNADCDTFDEINVADLVFMVKRIFVADFPCCELEEDVDGNGQFNVADIVYLVNYIFKGGPPPVPCYP
ncbi:MAG: hypothetical protein ABIJ12_10350 [bacterium]